MALSSIFDKKCMILTFGVVLKMISSKLEIILSKLETFSSKLELNLSKLETVSSKLDFNLSMLQNF